MYELSIVVWLVLAVITAFLAARKNRSFLGWLVIGLVIPLIGFILILVMPAGKPLEEAENSVKPAASSA